MNTIAQPLDYEVSEQQWWFVYDGLKVITGPIQCSGKISSPHILVTCDTEEECNTYILQNNIDK